MNHRRGIELVRNGSLVSVATHGGYALNLPDRSLERCTRGR